MLKSNHFAEVIRPLPRFLPDVETQALAALVSRRNQVMEMLVSEKSWLRTSRPPVKQRIQLHIDWLEKELGEIVQDLKGILRNSPVWREKENLLNCAWCGPPAGSLHPGLSP